MPNTRQFRVSSPTEIRNRIKEFLHKKINIVLADNRVIIGELEEVKQDGIVIKNMRLKKVFFAFDQLAEIYFDTIVA